MGKWLLICVFPRIRGNAFTSYLPKIWGMAGLEKFLPGDGK